MQQATDEERYRGYMKAIEVMRAALLLSDGSEVGDIVERFIFVKKELGAEYDVSPERIGQLINGLVMFGEAMTRGFSHATNNSLRSLVNLYENEIEDEFKR